MIQQKVFEMMNAAKERIIKTMQERGITKINLVMTQEEWEKENADSPDGCAYYDEYRNGEAPYVIAFNKWGNGIAYAAYSVELVDGPEEPCFKLDCYNDEEGSEWFYDSDLGCLSMSDVYDAMEKALEIEDEPKKVWVVTYVGLSDSEWAANGYCECHVCGTLEAAKAKMRQLRDAEIENCKAEGCGYKILKDETTEMHMSRCCHGEQIRLEIHEEEVK